MATYNKFQAWVDYLTEGVNASSDQFVVALTNSAPVATNSILTDITQIAYTNLSTRNITTASSSQTTGTYSLVVNDLTLTASGGSVAAFRYVVVYDDTVANDPLVAWFDYGSSITLADTETLLINFGSSLFTLT
jgi:hypothetical protein